MVDQETSSASLRIAFWKSQGIFLKGLKSSPFNGSPLLLPNIFMQTW